MYLLNLIVTLALAEDFSTGKVTNRLTSIGFLSSQVWAIFNYSMKWALISFVYGMILIAIMLPLFAIGCMGAGDIKLLSILPAYVGIKGSLLIIAGAFIVAAIIGILKLISNRVLVERLYFLMNYINSLRITHTVGKYDEFPEVLTRKAIPAYKIHFMMPVFISVMLWIGGITRV